jgi:CHASE3 domain sensor protein
MIGEAPAASGGAAGAATNLKHFRQAMTRAVLWPLAAMFALAAAFLALIVLLLNTANWVDHTDQVIAQIHVVEARLIDRETGLRGYLLTGNSEFLEPYTAATAALPPALDRLATLVADNPAQLGRLDAIAAERRAWEQFAQEAMLRYERGGDYEAYVSAGIGKRRMDAMRELLAGMVRAEASLRENRMAATDRMTWLVIGGSITQAALLGAFLAWATRRQILTLAQQYGAALAASARGAASGLGGRAPCRGPPRPTRAARAAAPRGRRRGRPDGSPATNARWAGRAFPHGGVASTRARRSGRHPPRAAPRRAPGKRAGAAGAACPAL